MRHLEKILCAALLAAALPSAAMPIHGKSALPHGTSHSFLFDRIFSRDIPDGTSNTIFVDVVKNKRHPRPAPAVPEPGSFALLGLGLAGVAAAASRRRGQRAVRD